MKKTLLFLLLAISTLSACKKESKFKYSGLIQGIDKGACPCCGGFIVTINGSNAAYRCQSLPSGSTIDSTTHFPVKVNLNYTDNGLCEYTHMITVTSMIITY